MNHAVQLSELEWNLVLDLLETERRELPSEIHHTDSSRVHDELEQRRRDIEQLIAKLRQQPLPA